VKGRTSGGAIRQPRRRSNASGATTVVPEERRARLDAIFAALDPMRLLEQIGCLQDALWQHAIVRTAPATDQRLEAPVRFGCRCLWLDRASHTSGSAAATNCASQADLSAQAGARPALVADTHGSVRRCLDGD